MQCLNFTLPAIEEEVFTSIFKAIKLHKTLRFGYKSVGRSEYLEKQFDTYHVLCQKEQVFSWVMGFGDAVTVIKPESLRQDLKKTAERIAGKY